MHDLTSDRCAIKLKIKRGGRMFNKLIFAVLLRKLQKRTQ